MAQSNNLTIGIGIDTAKLRADAAIVRNELRQINAEVTAAAKAGDTAQLTASTQQQDALMRRLASIRSQITAGSKEVATFGGAFAELGTRLGEVGTAFGEMAERTIPHFREVLVLSLAAAGVAVVKFTTDAAKSVHELQESAEAIGINIEKLQSIRLSAAQVGGDPDVATLGMERFSRSLGQVQIAQNKVGEAFQKGKITVDQMRESMQEAAGVFGRLGVTPGHDVAQTLEATARELERMGDTAERAALAAEIFGRGWFKQIEFMKNFRENTEASRKTLEDYGLIVTEVTLKQSAAYLKSLNTLKVVFEAMRNITGNIMGQAFLPLFDGLTKLLGENTEKLKAWAQTTSTEMLPVMRDLVKLLGEGTGAKFETAGIADLASALSALGIAARIAAAGLNVLAFALDGVALALNALFGTHFTGQGLLIAAIIVRLTGAFRVLWAVLRVGASVVGFFLEWRAAIVAVAAAGGAAVGWPVLLVAAITALLPVLIMFRKEIGETLAAAIDWVRTKLSALGTYLSDIFNSVVGTVATAFSDAWNTAINFVADKIDWLISWYDAAIAKAKELLALVGIGTGGSDYGGGDLSAVTGATGGYVRGPGSGTSDSVLARLSNGEFVINAGSVRRLGVGFLQGLNSFAAGGFVSAPLPRFATGGLVAATGASGSAVHLHLLGSSYELRGDKAVVNSLTREARRAGMLNAGRMPGALA